MANWPTRSRSSRVRTQAGRRLPRRCAECGATGRLELDHIEPLAEGGRDELGNCQNLCPPCHRVKSEAERKRGIERARARRDGFPSKRYRPTEAHPGKLA